MSKSGPRIHMRVCTVCGENKRTTEFRMPHRKKAERHRCMECENSSLPELLEDPTSELNRLRVKVAPTAAEWEVVQRAARAMEAFLKVKCGGLRVGPGRGTHFTGETGWEIIEASTTSALRFHQLSSLATVQFHVWRREQTGVDNANRAGGVKKYTEEQAAKVKELYVRYSLTAISAMTGLSMGTVQHIVQSGNRVRGRGRRGRPNVKRRTATTNSESENKMGRRPNPPREQEIAA